MEWYWILLIIGCALFLFIIICLSLAHYWNAKHLQEEIHQLRIELGQSHARAELYNNQRKEAEAKLLELSKESGIQLQGEAHTSDLQNELDKLHTKQSELEGRILEDTTQLQGIALTQYQFLQSLAHSKEVQLQVENETHGLESRNRELSKDIISLELQKESLGHELQRMLCITKIIEEDKDHVVWDPILTEKQAKLINILQDLINMYPDLQTDFANIEWKKIWMPQLQQLGSVIETKGIYRLVLRDDLAPTIHIKRDGQEQEMPACYVGQAVSIKDRWYQHVKKMIGAMPAGNEKVYEWRPEAFKWCIIESGDDIDLNYSEKYWIQYYCAKDGLNKKLG